MTLLPSNATPWERAIESVVETSAQVDVPIRELKDPDLAPEELLPYLAWEFGFETWDDDLPENIKRARINGAVNTQRLKGTRQSVQDVIESFGANVVLVEWWQQTPQGAPFTFDLLLTVDPAAPDVAALQDAIVREVERTMPARCSFQLIIGENATGGLGFLGRARGVSQLRLDMELV